MVVKALHNIKLKDIILLDATKKPDSLKYWFIPLFFCRKQIDKLCKQIFDLIGGNTINDLQDEADKILMYRNIQILEALHKAIYAELGLRSKINAWKVLINKDIRNSEQLQRVFDQIKKYSGIEIKTPDDVKSFEDYIQFKIDKYKEMFPEKEAQDTNLMKVIYSVFNFMGEPFNENMRLLAFAEMKAEAEEKIKQAAKQAEDGQ
jgi:hypothetical protein